MAKPKVAFFDFASCEGCQLAVLNCEDILLDIVGLVDIVEFREAISDKAEKYDIAFIEGSIHRDEDLERLKDIRERSTYLVALGACACTGNLQSRSNLYSPMENFNEVYGKKAIKANLSDEKFKSLWEHKKVKRVDDCVKVDFYLRGCPIDANEFLELVKAVLLGKSPYFPANPVCVECKRVGNECVYDKGQVCMGQVTWGGCNATCVSNGWVCEGCRGILPDANIKAHFDVMKEKGIKVDRMLNKYRLHCSDEPISKGVK
jgi:coenzyme F420-reducing hydrogenase gamma subunit